MRILFLGAVYLALSSLVAGQEPERIGFSCGETFITFAGVQDFGTANAKLLILTVPKADVLSVEWEMIEGIGAADPPPTVEVLRSHGVVQYTISGNIHSDIIACLY